MSPFGRRRSARDGPETAESLLKRMKLPFQLSRIRRFSGDPATVFDVLTDTETWPLWVPGAAKVEALSWDEPGLRVRLLGRRLGVAVDAVQCLDPSHGPLLTTITYESLLVRGRPYSYGEQHLFWYDMRVHDGYVDVQAGFASRPGNAGKSMELRAASTLIVRDLQSALTGLTREASRRESGS